MVPRTDVDVVASSIDTPSAFGELFDRQATTMFRYFVRRVGPETPTRCSASSSASPSSGEPASTPNGPRHDHGSTGSPATCWPGTVSAKRVASRPPPVAAGAAITMPIEDAFYGFRRYEADDLEGQHWHFHESLEAIRARERRVG